MSKDEGDNKIYPDSFSPGNVHDMLSSRNQCFLRGFLNTDIRILYET